MVDIKFFRVSHILPENQTPTVQVAKKNALIMNTSEAELQQRGTESGYLGELPSVVQQDCTLLQAILAEIHMNTALK